MVTITRRQADEAARKTAEEFGQLSQTTELDPYSAYALHRAIWAKHAGAEVVQVVADPDDADGTGSVQP